MARFTAGATTSAGSTTLPIISVYGSADTGPRVVEIGCFNTTATSVRLKVCKLTSAGTQGAGLTETCLDMGAFTADCSAFNTHSSTGPTVVDAGYYFVLGAAIGSGIILTFPVPMAVPGGTANGVGLIVTSGTGQVCDAYITWDE